jgi:competence protein ComEC
MSSEMSGKIKNIVGWQGLLLFSLLIVMGFIWYLVIFTSTSKLKVGFLDIGQGDSIYIEAPNGNQVLIDGGPNKGVLRALGEVMPWADHSLDLVVATHADADHIGGLPAVLNRYQVAAVLSNGQGSKTAIYKSWQEAIVTEVKTGAKSLLAKRGERFILDRPNQIYLDVLFPYSVPSGKDTNDGSIVAKLTYGNQAFILTGDATIKVEQQLLANPSELRATVLKAGHHGSKTSSSAPFVAAVAPTYAIISAGEHNRYGHPHQITLDTLTKAGAKILRTDQLGTIICLSTISVTTCDGKAL